MTTHTKTNPVNTVKVWDLVVRVFHWSLVTAYAITWLTEDELMDLHVIAGYIVLGLISFRVLWGFIGSKHARFSDFVYPPATIKHYFNGLMRARPPHYYGHNPAGGLMMILLLLSLFAATLSGVKAYGVAGYGPLATHAELIVSASLAPITDAHANGDGVEEDDDDEEFWEEVHEFFANLSLLLVFTHIAAVLLSSILHNENLTKAMITGRKPVPPDDD